jgi:hypothetical protein
VAEAKAVLAGDLGLVRSDQLLADEGRQAWCHRRLFRHERLDGTAVEDLALDRAALEHRPLGLFELVEARREQRLEGRRDDYLAVPLAGHRQHLADEEGVPSRCARDVVAQDVTDPSGNQRLDVRGRQRLQPKLHRPAGAPLRQLGTSHAQEQDRRTGREQCQVLDEVEEGLLAGVDVVEEHHQGS